MNAPGFIRLAALAAFGAAPLSAEIVEATAAAGGRDFVRALSAGSALAARDWRSAGAAPDNFGELPGGLFRGAALGNREQYGYLRRVLGVAVVVNLKEYPDDAQACRINGLRCVQFPLRLSWPFVTNIDWEILRQAFRSVLEAQRRDQRVYFHCEHGADRTGALAAALTVRREACGKIFGKDLLWARVEADLKRHRFHGALYPALGRDIKDLVYEFEKNEPWLCRAP